MKKKFKAVVFDCGNVAIPYCFSKVCYGFAEYARVWDDGLLNDGAFRKARPHEIMAAMYGDDDKNSPLRRFERGDTLISDMGAAAFRNSIRAKFRMEITDEEFDDIWNSMFLPYDPGMLAWLEALRVAGYPLIMATNNNAIHMKFLRETYPQMFEQFERIVTSQEIGLVKSDGKIFYDHVPTAARSLVKDIEYSDMIYFDDVPAYAETFRKCGGSAVLFSETVPAQLEAVKLGLEW
ncbi:hypothetical protein KGQ34_01875 [Patescibacteria group bacterium]|nr:hypothetical protein [Patescibacteria group bacterium]